jgi:DNA methylase
MNEDLLVGRNPIRGKTTASWRKLQEAIHDREPVSGLTHSFYRYPARFAPSFARRAILSFTKPGDLVFDPFMGGGTSLVEALAHGRRAVGTDISSLAAFLSKIKTTRLSEAELLRVVQWGQDITANLNLRVSTARPAEWVAYQRNISAKETWPVRKFLEQSLERLDLLHSTREKAFARCVLLRTGQWALDCREVVPSVEAVRERFSTFLQEMIVGAREFAGVSSGMASNDVMCLHRSTVGIEKTRQFRRLGAPRLIVTSPPYPGVHVLYHRWQVQGRRESPAPFWIAGTTDGAGSSFYTFGDRHQKDLKDYFESALAAFSSIASVSDHKTKVVQMVAFGDPSWQLSAYLEMMKEAGFSELRIPELSNRPDGRIWREVPNRKWYADIRGRSSSSSEFVLVHEKAR